MFVFVLILIQPQAILRTTGPNIGMFVLILMISKYHRLCQEPLDDTKIQQNVSRTTGPNIGMFVLRISHAFSKTTGPNTGLFVLILRQKYHRLSQEPLDQI